MLSENSSRAKVPFMLVWLMLAASIAPLAAASSTETQFSDGTTSYTHTFSGAGTGSTAGVVMPIGAEGTGATFNLLGEAATTTWANASTNTNFGGPATTNGLMSVPWFTQGYRTNIDVDNDQAFLRPQETTQEWKLTSSSDISSSTNGYHNTTGAFFANGDQGYLSASQMGVHDTVSGGTWSYGGPVVEQGDEYQVIIYTSGSTNLPYIHRWNKSTGSYIGQGTFVTTNCNANAARYIYDATSDGNGTVWTASFNIRAFTKWSVNGGTWTCQNYWAITGQKYPMAIAFEPNTNEMWMLVRNYQLSPHRFYAEKVNRSNPLTVIQSHYLADTTLLGYNVYGFDIQGPRITLAAYAQKGTGQGTHHIFLHTGNWYTYQGAVELPNYHGHYGLERASDGKLLYTCYYISYCNSNNLARKIFWTGAAAPSDVRLPTSNNSSVTSSFLTLTSSVTEVSLATAITYEPSATSVEFEVTNDGGTTWKRAMQGQAVTFANAGTQIGWRAYLNGTSTATPILDTVGLSYVATYYSNGHMRLYRNFGGGAGGGPVAATVWWNASTPGGSSLALKWVTATTSCTFTGTSITNGQPTFFTSTSGWYTLCIWFYVGSGNAYTPLLDDFNIAIISNAPKDVSLDIGGDGSNEWTYQNTLLGTVSVVGGAIVAALNSAIPDIGTGTVIIDVNVESQSAGKVSITSFSIDYTMQTVNLDINYDEDMILHERVDSYEVITRHVIGENANEISSAQLDILGQPSSSAPSLLWASDGTLVDDDPDDWIVPDSAGTWTNNSNGIQEIHWKFRITSEFREQNNVGFRVSCTDSAGYTPMMMSTGPAGIVVNQSYGLGWLKVRDNDGEVLYDDAPDDAWIAASETLHFQGAIWYAYSEDAPLDSTFDVKVMKQTTEGKFLMAKDSSNPYGEFFISVQMDDFDRPEGVQYLIEIDNPRDPLKVLTSNSSWARTYRIDATPPTLVDSWPPQGAYEAGSVDQSIRVRVQDAVSPPEQLTLHYWVEYDNDDNRNGYADESEYVNQTMVNLTDSDDKYFFGHIDDSRNPNMAQVSYYVTGTDPAGHPLTNVKGPGFEYDLSTYRTRVDTDAVFTGLDWMGHVDGGKVFSGVNQHISLGLVDANGRIDYEDISLIFDFEGPDPTRDQQRISYSGQNNTFWSDGPYIILDDSCNDGDDGGCGVPVITNDTGIPWIRPSFIFRFSWDWPDEDLSDLALEYKELGVEVPTRVIFEEHTFRVENDLVLDADSYMVEDVQEPRTGVLSDGSRVVPNDRLRWSGRVVYEGSDVPAPRNLGITVETFDGVQYWSDGSLTEEGGFSLEVPLGAAPSLASSEMRTFLTGIRNVPGRGEDMTRDTVATTLQLHVDHSPPRVIERLAPIDIIDISNTSMLTQVPVEFIGSEDADLAGSPQWVHWLMRDDNGRQIASGSSELGMRQEGTAIEWTGTVDLVGDGMNPPIQDYVVGFWIEGWDVAGNPLATESNSKSDPVREPVELDGDHELQWIRFGATGPQLTIERVSADREVMSNGANVEITAWVANLGGPTNTSFTVGFYSGDDLQPFATQALAGISDEAIPVKAIWKAEKGVDRVRVVVDIDDEINEVDESDNSAEVGVSVEYAWGLGWVDLARQNMLTVIGIIIAMIILPVVGVVSMRGGVGTSVFEDDLFYDEDEDYYDEEDEEEDDWE